MTAKQALTAALHGEITNAIGAFRRDLAFTAPELIDMRIEQLEERLHAAVDHAVEALAVRGRSTQP